MGLNVNSVKLLLLAHARGIPFDNILMIGRQSFSLTAGDIRALMRLPIADDTKRNLTHLRLGADVYSEAFFELCGARRVDSIDKTAYEGATVLHDLNLPVPDALFASYDVIVDGGSIEHVFNVPVAFKNYMQMLKVGGHYICNTATNNYSGHGFYQLSPEIFFAVFGPENGFHIVDAFLYEENGRNTWYRLSQPADAMRRMTFQNSVPAHLLVLAAKRADVPLFTEPPQQRMYDAAWAQPGVDVIGRRSLLKAAVFRWLDRVPRLKWFVLNTWNTHNRFRGDLFQRVDSENGIGPKSRRDAPDGPARQ
jgi:hypothetical protein